MAWRAVVKVRMLFQSGEEKTNCGRGLSSGEHREQHIYFPQGDHPDKIAAACPVITPRCACS